MGLTQELDSTPRLASNRVVLRVATKIESWGVEVSLHLLYNRNRA